jgi:peroxiredoxin family protein
LETKKALAVVTGSAKSRRLGVAITTAKYAASAGNEDAEVWRVDDAAMILAKQSCI